MLFNASFVTTIYLLGSGLPLLLSRPDVAAALPGDDELARDCVDEILRCESPVQFLTRAAPGRRRAGRACRCARGEIVLLLLGAANRDPDRFADPGHLRRRPGQVPLARLRRRARTTASVRRCPGPRGGSRCPGCSSGFPGLALAGEPVDSGSLFLRGMKSVPVTAD